MLRVCCCYSPAPSFGGLGIAFLVLVSLVTPVPCLSADDPYPNVVVRLVMGDSLDQFGYPIQPAGDQNGDGYDDIWVGEPYDGIRMDSTGAPIARLLLFYGGDPMDSIPDFVIGGGMRFAKNVGDMNGDGYEDIAIAFWDAQRTTRLYYGGPLLDTIPDMIFPAIDPQDVIGGHEDQILGGCDLTGDGLPDLVLGEWWVSDTIESGISYLYSSEPVFDTIPDFVFRRGLGDEYYDFGLNQQFLPNAGGNDYLCTGRRSRTRENGGGSVLLFRTGAALDTIPDLEIHTPLPDTFMSFGIQVDVPGDLNGDGAPDLVLGMLGSSRGWIYYGGPLFDTLPDVTVVPTYEDFAGIGDVNNDGYNDFIVGEQPFLGRAWIYYGGPDLDGYVDLKVWASWTVQHLGRTVMGVGDVNGDGIDDFAVAGNIDDYPDYPGVVYVYAGYDSIPTDVESPGRGTIPADFDLKYNYPNPFNSTSVIEFSLPRRMKITLSIHNILGEQVRVLLDEVRSAGTHSVVWDGRDGQGSPVASGIYLYSLESATGCISKKMMLVK